MQERNKNVDPAGWIPTLFEMENPNYDADMVITNPPFSLFREFLSWLVEGKKQFSIIGNMNAITKFSMDNSVLLALDDM